MIVNVLDYTIKGPRDKVIKDIKGLIYKHKSRKEFTEAETLNQRIMDIVYTGDRC